MPGSRYPRPAAAWYAVAVLFLAYTFSAIDRQILTLLVGPVRADLVLSDFELSLLQGAAFSLLFVFVGFPVGRLADVHSRRGIIACGIAFWCLMTTACGLYARALLPGVDLFANSSTSEGISLTLLEAMAAEPRKPRRHRCAHPRLAG